MYICCDCGHVFDEPKRFTEKHGLSSPPYETWLGCTHCGGAYEEYVHCDFCGEWGYEESYSKIDSCTFICRACEYVTDLDELER